MADHDEELINVGVVRVVVVVSPSWLLEFNPQP
jgi:hypothetical protein